MSTKGSEFIRVILVFLCLAIAGSCKDDSKPVNKLAGTWTIESISTDNQALNQLLGTLLPSLPLNQLRLNFGEDQNLLISYPTPEGEKSIKAAYAYDDTELALRFDDILPIPFNAFGIAELTDTRLVLTRPLSRSIAETIGKLVADRFPPYAPYVTAILAQIDEDGFNLELTLVRTGTSLP
ncbi:MAG: hypothetical protein LIP00_06130 [Parabacteroides sp.]|nr:hypothetical protein [Parabacteroides sp.]